MPGLGGSFNNILSSASALSAAGSLSGSLPSFSVSGITVLFSFPFEVRTGGLSLSSVPSALSQECEQDYGVDWTLIGQQDH